MHCSKCGAKNTDDARFCYKCGAQLTSHTDIQLEDILSSQLNLSEPVVPMLCEGERITGEISAKKRKRNLAAICITAVVVIAIAVGAGIYMNTGTRLLGKTLSRSEQYLSENKYEDAIISFGKVLKIDPKNEKAYMGIADGYTGLEDIKRVEGTLEDGLEALPDSEAILSKLVEVRTEMGSKYLQDGMYDKATEAFQKAVSLYPYASDTNTIAATDGDIIVGGVTLTDGQYLANGASTPSDSKPDNGGYVYFKDHILVLHNAVIGSGKIQYKDYAHDDEGETAICSASLLTITLEGDSFAVCRHSTTSASVEIAMLNEDETLSISGNGSLTTVGGTAGITSGGDLEIIGNVAINAITSGEEEGAGLFAQGTLIISKNAVVTAVGTGYGVGTDGGSIIVDGGALIAVALSSENDARALTRYPELTDVSVIAASMNSDGSNQLPFNERDFYSYNYRYLKIEPQ